jgi:hypothetical protein
MNLMDVNREFRTEEDCLEELAKVRWPDGVRCITCGCKEISKITRKPTAKNKRTRSFQCLEKTGSNISASSNRPNPNKINKSLQGRGGEL